MIIKRVSRINRHINNNLYIEFINISYTSQMLRNIGIISLFIYINLPLTFQNSDAIPVTGEESHKILREGEQEELGGNENILNIKEILERKKKGEVTFSISLDFTSAEYLGDGEYKKSLGIP